MGYSEEWYQAYLARGGQVVGEQRPAPPVSVPAEPEGAFMERLRTVALTTGHLFYHPYSSKRSTPGWPDCAIVHPDGGVLRLWELKTADGTVSPAQRRWLDALQRVTAVDAQVVRPCNWSLITQLLQRSTP